MHQRYVTDSRHISWLCLFLGGFLIGTFVLNIRQELVMQNMELLDASSLSRLRYMQIDSGAFFVFLLRKRLGAALWLCLLSTTYLGCLAVSGYAVYTGMLAGVVLSVASLRYGLMGIILMLVSVLPQYLLLVPAGILLMRWCCQVCNALYHPERNKDMRYGTRKQYLCRRMVQLMVILLIIFTGCLLEGYLNPLLLSGFLNLF